LARILLCWELGGGLGHLTPLQQISKYYIQQGHEVWLASKDVAKVRRVFADLPVKLLQAPFTENSRELGVEKQAASGFADLLRRVGYHDELALTGLVQAWQTLLGLVKPDLILIDHSPTALLASRGMAVPKIAVGSGFSTPDDNSPVGLFFHNEIAKKNALQAEEGVLRIINQVCLTQKIPTLSSLRDLFSQQEFCLTRNYSELDHYGYRSHSQRRDFVYVGSDAGTFGELVDFPHYKGPKVFCYLKPCPELPVLLKTLQSIECSAIVVTAGVPKALIEAHRAKHIVFSDVPVNMQHVIERATLGVLNAGMNTTAQFLKAGIPVALLPLHVEQLLVARRVEALKAGCLLNLQSVETAVASLNRAYSSQAKTCAAIFADKYKDFDPQRELMKELAAIEERYLR